MEFAQKVYGEDLADAMYLGTYGGISYFGLVFYEKDAIRPSFVITDSEGEYHFLPSEKFALDSDEDMKDFERRQHIWWDYNAVIQSAFRRGKRKGMASRMKAKGIAIEVIAEYTGLTTEEIEYIIEVQTEKRFGRPMLEIQRRPPEIMRRIIVLFTRFLVHNY